MSGRPELILLVVSSGALNLWDLSRNGWANAYYAAAVKSMSTSWHNFLFNSFDPSGIMTIDKPPLAFWIQALSARIFGFNSWSLLVPDALMGVGTVVVIYDLVHRRFGRLAGFVAGATLTITPIQVAMARDNNPDMTVIFCSVLALWFAQRGFETGRTRWLAWAGVFVGLGFEAKMGVAVIIVPGIVLAWLWTAPHGLWRSMRQLLCAGAPMLVVGLAWPLLVSLTPAINRPYISGTSANSIWQLITVYNGLGRVTGQAGGPGSSVGGAATVFGGSPGVFRLLNSELGGQTGWLLGFAAVSLVGLVSLRRMRRSDPGTAWTISVGSAFVLSALVFSFAGGIFHPYYVSFLAPFNAALVGAGVAMVGKRARHARVLAPAVVAGGVITETVVLHAQDAMTWLLPVLFVAGAVGSVASNRMDGTRQRLVAVTAVLATLAIAPAAWAVDTLNYATNSTFPAGGPAITGVLMRPGGPGDGFAGGSFGRGGVAGGGFGRGGSAGGGFGGDGAGSLGLAVSYADAHGGGTVAVPSQTSAETEIIAHDARVAGIGGFSGNESEVSAGWLAAEVRIGKIGWVLDDDAQGGFAAGIPDGWVGARDAMKWVREACLKATTIDGSELYRCSGRSAQILTAAGSGRS
ncbi:MAG: ArnT family glycosyltransferase [Solirubrobacteraceae bacterium]